MKSNRWKRICFLREKQSFVCNDQRLCLSIVILINMFMPLSNSLVPIVPQGHAFFLRIAKNLVRCLRGYVNDDELPLFLPRSISIIISSNVRLRWQRKRKISKKDQLSKKEMLIVKPKKILRACDFRTYVHRLMIVYNVPRVFFVHPRSADDDWDPKYLSIDR